MQIYHQREAIRIAKRMIKAFFLERDVDKVLDYFNPDGFSWIGPGEQDILNDLDDIRTHFQKYVDKVTELYRIVREEYIIGGSSLDTCIVIVKLNFQGVSERRSFRSALHFSFYFQLINDQLFVSHYHVHIPNKNMLFENSGHLMIDRHVPMSSLPVQMDLQYQHSLLNVMCDADHIAMKSFRYEDELPYCYVNRAFLTLLGYSGLQNFVAQNNFSSLAHIHPDDQQKYLDCLASRFPKPCALNPERAWQWHAAYRVTYRTQTFDRKERFVLEWGNLLTLNGHPIATGFVLPLDEPDELYHAPVEIESRPESWKSNISALLEDVGVHIGNLMVIYPKHRKLVIRGADVELTPIEFKLLMILSDNINSPVGAERFFEILWNDAELNVTSFTLKTHMSNLRRKLRNSSGDQIKLVHVKNKGYQLSIPEY